VNEQMAALRGGAIIPEIKLYCALCWLAGGSYSDVFFFCGISRASFFRVCWQTIRLINSCPGLAVRFPHSDEDYWASSSGFSELSAGCATQNCVGVIDGFHLETVAPPKKVVGNVRSYYSGHYKTYGINVQAIADYHSRFTYIAVAGPGSMNDCQAINECEASRCVESIPFPYIVIGDSAYMPTERLVPIYGGAAKEKKLFDDFDYYASQSRIRIEMAFGLMVRKWGILWRPLRIDFASAKELVVCIARLHNFCIDERLESLPDLATYDPTSECGVTDRGMNVGEALVAEQEQNRHLSDEVYDDPGSGHTGYSAVRYELAKRIQTLHLERPMR